MSFSERLPEGAILGADKNYDAEALVEGLKTRGIEPHVAINGTVSKNGKVRKTAVPSEVAASIGYAISQRLSIYSERRSPQPLSPSHRVACAPEPASGSRSTRSRQGEPLPLDRKDPPRSPPDADRTAARRENRRRHLAKEQSQRQNATSFSKKERNLIERLFGKLKQFCAIATRYDKLATNCLGAIRLVAAVIQLN